MNKEANLKANVIYIILAVAFIAVMFAFIWDQMGGASVWADYYSKEISRVVNSASPGQTITLDVHKATEIAYSNNIRDFKEVFQFDNTQNQICVKLSQGRKSCYYYFNNVDITESKIVLGKPTNALTFKIEEKAK